MKSDYTYHGPVVVFDLDDTLYHERDYALCCYAGVAEHLHNTYGINPEQVMECMTGALAIRQNPIDPLYESGLISNQIAIEELLRVYRNTIPELTLPEQSQITLDTLQQRGVRMGLLSDGRSHNQRMKIQALGIAKYFCDSDIIISEEIGCDKLQRNGYVHFMHRYPEASRFIYIGDNTAKDFKNANLLGWTTVCLMDKDNINIHVQDFTLPSTFLPTITIENLTEALKEIS